MFVPIPWEGSSLYILKISIFLLSIGMACIIIHHLKLLFKRWTQNYEFPILKESLFKKHNHRVKYKAPLDIDRDFLSPREVAAINNSDYLAMKGVMIMSAGWLIQYMWMLWPYIKKSFLHI